MCVARPVGNSLTSPFASTLSQPKTSLTQHRWRGSYTIDSEETSVTVAVESESDVYEVKYSEFISYLRPCKDEKEAKAYAKDLKGRGRHNHACWAYRGLYLNEKASDDGEPSGTAGEPILQAMQVRKLRNAVCVVTRDFGGVKLGKGGLMDAYGKSAMRVLRKADYIPLKK